MEVRSRVDADAREAAGMGVTGTPGFFVNGRFVSGAKPYEEFKKIVDEELARQ
jgi:predicted DsbA family dithiol-disulfide isomerase